MEKILDIVELIAYEKGLDGSAVIDLVKECVINMANSEFGEDIEYFVELDQKDRNIRLLHKVMVVGNDDERLEGKNQNYISIDEARRDHPDIGIGDEINYELSLGDMNRNAINKLFGMLEFRLQKLIGDQIFLKLKTKIGKLVSGPVVRVDDEQNTYVEIEEIRGVLPLKNRIKGEIFKVGDVISCVIRHVGATKSGIYVELSRTSPKFLEELLSLEVPEIKDGEVVIKKSARIPGDRAKIAVYSNNPKIDPIGSSVGVKGVRINAVSRELNGENIDCIEYSDIPEIFILKALAPANVVSVSVDQGSKSDDEEQRGKAIVTIMADQKSKAIGKKGVNIRLASMLTGYDIELVEVGGTSEGMATEDGKKKGIDALESLFKN